MIITTKFGGSSLADADHFRKVKAILEKDPARRYIVVSAPGKRNHDDIKVTDLLYSLYDAAEKGGDTESLLQAIYDRYLELVKDLDLTFDLGAEIDTIRRSLVKPEKEYLASRGEYLNAKLMSLYLGWPMVDCSLFVTFDDHHLLDGPATYQKGSDLLKGLEHAVVPGFYGADKSGIIRVFSRGGSDITGSIVSRCVGADLYENWTDVNGMLTADPRIVSDPKTIETISYQELRELAYMGASVLHEDALAPIRQAGIPVNIRNTNQPDEPGTMILASDTDCRGHLITGIAGKKGLSNIQLDKDLMNEEVGFGAKVLSILASHGVPYEHTPTSIDTMSVLVETADLEKEREAILEELKQALHPDRICIEDHIALAAIVGKNMARHPGLAAKVLQVVADAGINVRMIDVSFSEVNMILAVDEKNYEKTITAIYNGLQEYL